MTYMNAYIQVPRMPRSKAELKEIAEACAAAALFRKKKIRTRLTNKKLRRLGYSDGRIKKYRRLTQRQKGIYAGAPGLGKRR